MSESALPVYIIHWNAPEWCLSAARSILASVGIKVELAVVDNGGMTEDARSDLEAMGVCIIPTGRNFGYASGANVALRHWLGETDHEFSVIGAHDLHVEPGALLALLKVAQERPDFGVLGPVLTAPFSSAGGVWTKKGAYQLPLDESPTGQFWEVDWISGTCMLLRRACAESVGFFDERLGSYCEDVDWCLRAKDAGWRVGVVGDAAVLGLGSSSGHAGALIAANTIRLLRKRAGSVSAGLALLRLVGWTVRAGVATLAGWRSREKRATSRSFLGRHLSALRHLVADPRGRGLPADVGKEVLPLVSVIIPTRNRRAFLEEAIESVKAQTYPNWELVVVDDCSEDDTWAWLSSLEHSSIRAVRLERHSERSAARNRGLAEASGEYVLFLDDDDLLTPRALECLMQAAERHPEAVGVAGAAVQFDGRGHRRRVSWVRRGWKGPVWPLVLWGWCIWQGQAVMRRHEVVATGGWNERLVSAEDHEFWLRLGFRGPTVLVCDPVLENRVHITRRRADTAEIESRFRRAFAEGLSEADARLARRVLLSREAFGRASKAYVENKFCEGFNWWIRSLRQAPDVTLSAPLRKTVLGVGVRIFVGVVLGSRGAGLARRVCVCARQLLRRAPQGEVQVSGSSLRSPDYQRPRSWLRGVHPGTGTEQRESVPEIQPFWPDRPNMTAQ